MAHDLKKFVNAKFLKTINLRLLMRLFERQPDAAGFIERVLSAGDDAAGRASLRQIFEGPENALPRGLIADLHHIAELGTENGMHLLQERAAARNVIIAPALNIRGEAVPLDPKHFALLMFLDHRAIFDAASDMLARQARAFMAEYVGIDEGVEPSLDPADRDAFEAAASELFQRDHCGAYCRTGWYEDGNQTILVVTHGAPVSVIPVIDDNREDVISYRSVEHAILAYNVATGRLEIGGVRKALRAELAEFFAVQLLDCPGFFAGEDCQNLYSLERVERAGLNFRVEHAFDPGIRQVDIAEVQIDRIGSDPRTGEASVEAVSVIKDFRGNSLARVGEFGDRVTFGSGRYRLGHMTIRVHITDPGERPARVTVKIKPPSIAAFKRYRFESRIMELLRRNGFCHDRQPAQTAIAAE